jgi:DNA-directed RNA polymerase subunit beta'
MPTTIGRLLLNEIVPEEHRQDLSPDAPVGSKEVSSLLQRIADKNPELYKDISHKLLKLGSRGTSETSTSFSLSDLKSPIDKKSIIADIERQEAGIFADPTLTQSDREKRLVEIYGKMSNEMPGQIYDEALKQGSNLAKMVASGARGNKSQLSSNIGADWLMLDDKSNPVPVGVKSNYSEGLTPAEYFASSYGTRRGLVATKLATADAGYLSKQLTASSAPLIVTEKDCGTNRGIVVDTEDADNSGSILARDVKGVPAGTILNSKTLGELKNKGVTSLVVRSPITCKTHGGGLCAICAGLRERNKLPELRENIGIAAASSLAEPLSQGMMSEKHCLMRGTKVRMADGSSRQIESINRDDVILGANKYGETFPVKVLECFDNGVQEVYEYSFRTNQNEPLSVTCTPNHQVLCTYVRVGAGRPKFADSRFHKREIGDEDGIISIVVTMGPKHDHVEKAKMVNAVSKGNQPTFDLYVASTDHLYVLDNGLVVSNSGGVASAAAKSSTSGFKGINALFQVPEVFPYEAAVAEEDGRVNKIESAPQGGHFVTVGSKKHYVGPDRELSVKFGDNLEAGEALSEGILNPAKVTKYRGVGEGRVYLMNALRKQFKDSNLGVNRRNLEVVVRGVVNHVRVDDPDSSDTYLPDDTVEYEAFERSYVPRQDAKTVKPSDAIGKYLENPILHYTVGTRITPKMAKTLDDTGESELLVHDKAPGFSPEMVRLMDNSAHSDDWMKQLGSTYLKKNLITSVQGGDAKSNIHGVHFLPALAEGTNFGRPGVDATGKPIQGY